jgi:hypothetical protein
MVGSNGWPDGCEDILRARSIAAMHCIHRRSPCTPYSPHPSGMRQSHYMLHGVMQEQRDAIGKPHVEGDLRPVCEDDIRLREFCGGMDRRVPVHRICAVHLPYVEDGIQAPPQCRKRAEAVLLHIFLIIPHRPAHIQRLPRCRADAAAPRDYPVHD